MMKETLQDADSEHQLIMQLLMLKFYPTKDLLVNPLQNSHWYHLRNSQKMYLSRLHLQVTNMILGQKLLTNLDSMISLFLSNVIHVMLM